MAFPSITSVTDTVSAAVDPQIYNLPATVAANDLLILIHGGRYSLADVAPSGWTQKSHTLLLDGSLTVYAFKAAGTEGGGTVSVGIDDANIDNGLGRVYRIAASSWSQNLADVEGVTTGDTGNDSNPDSPSITSAGGSADNLFIAIYACRASFTTFTSSPSGYTTDSTYFENTSDDSGNETGLASAHKNAAAATDDPGTFAMTGSNNWATTTIVVRPAAGGLKGNLSLLGVGT